MLKKLLFLAVLVPATLRAQDVVVPYQYAAEGKPTPIEWGLDLAWKDEANIRTGVFYAGRDVIDIIRLSFQPTKSVEDGTWSDEQQADLKYRADAVLRWCKPGVRYNLNDDHASVAPWYNAAGTSAMRGERWAKLIDMAADYYKSRGLTNLVSISPFNEPDYGWDQGYSASTRKADFKAICEALKTGYDGKYADVRMCGGNTLNDDSALEWYNYLRDVLDEGNTHQLAGDFNHYADFFRQVRADGRHATADELHNVMEAMVGVEYGLQTGIWWGTAEYARAQFMKATYHDNPGRRLAYAEHRYNWTSAAVYRQTDGRVQAFGGMSERQSATTDYLLLATDGPVWYDGLRACEYLMHLPGGTGYQQGQTGAEVCVNIQRGPDIMPHIGEGVYKLMNVASGLLAGYSSKPTSGWTALAQRKNGTPAAPLQWVVTPRHETGDFSYYTFVLNTDNGMYLDLRNWNYESGAEVGVYPGDGNVLEQYYLEYAGGGAFYIRSRFSTKCLTVKGASKYAAAPIDMEDFTGAPEQQWRFLDAKATPDLKAPATPTNLTATPQTASVLLTWDAVADRDFKGYAVMRDSILLARDLTEPTFVDHEAEPNHTYIYKVYAEDRSLNRSDYSDTVSATVALQPALVCHLPLTSSLADTTENANDARCDAPIYDERGIVLGGTTDYLQLPYTIAHSDALTISLWTYYRGGSTWQRLFDFGNGTSQYLFLSPSCGSGMRFAIKNGGDEQQMTTTALSVNKWHHIVVTLGTDGGRLYVDGALKAQNAHIDIRPSDIRPCLNYIGRSQFPADPRYKGSIADLRIYNYALTPEEVTALTDNIEGVNAEDSHTNNASAYDLAGRKATPATRGIVVRGGRKVLTR